MPPVRPGFQHLGHGNGIGAQGDDVNGFLKMTSQLLDDVTADAATLAVNHAYGFFFSVHWAGHLL